MSHDPSSPLAKAIAEAGQTLREIVRQLRDAPILLAGIAFFILLLFPFLLAVLKPDALRQVPLLAWFLYALLGFAFLVIVLGTRTRRPTAAEREPAEEQPSESSPPPPEPAPIALSAEELRERFLRKLLEETDTLQLHTIDLKAATQRGVAKLELHAVFTDLDVYAVAEGERAEGKRLRQVEMEEIARDRRMPVLEAISRWSYLVLLGDPGSGKSTLINFITACLAGDWLGHPQVNRSRLGDAWQLPRLLPIRVVLRDYAARGLIRGRTLWQFIADEMARIPLEDGTAADFAPFLYDHLKHEGGILLLDGLDEVPEAQQRREKLKAAVEAFRIAFPKCRIVVTSRPYAYEKPEWQLTGFEVRYLAPFSEEQIDTFIERWYTYLGHKDPALGPDTADLYARQLKHALDKNPRLSELAPNPLLLTLMASLHRWREGGALPERRQELYEEIIKLLIDLWQRPKLRFDQAGNPVGEEYDVFWELGIAQEDLRKALEKLAYEAHRDQPVLQGTHDIPADRVAGVLYDVSSTKERISIDRVIRYITYRTGILIEREQARIFAFPHRTFQEYLAACYLTRPENDWPYSLYEHEKEDDERWREAVLLAAAKERSSIWTFVDVFCPAEWPKHPTDADFYPVLRAAQALLETETYAEVPERHQTKMERLRRRLADLLEQGALPARERVVAGRALSVLGDPRPGVGLDPDTGLPDILWVEVPAGPFLMGSDKEKDPNAYEDETPQHEVVLPTYYMARYPVTNAQFRAFVDDSGYDRQEFWTDAGWAWKEESSKRGPADYGKPFNLPNHPVVGITWYEALAFARWMNRQLQVTGGRLKVYRLGTGEVEVVELGEGWEVTLPSEAEWEKAARGTDGRIYPWGNEWQPDYLNWDGLGIGATSAVGCFPQGACPYGILDASGNVWEWTRSLWGKKWEAPDYRYPYDLGDEREDLDAPPDIYRVMRGGSWRGGPRIVRVPFRSWWQPVGSRLNLGLRLVCRPQG